MKTTLYLAILCATSMTLIAAEVAEKTVKKSIGVPVSTEMTEEEKAAEQTRFDDIQLPPNDSPEYWVVRSDAITELTKLLANKRSEMKQKRQMLADYLLQTGKAEEMASQNIQVPDDPKLYAEATGFDAVFAEKDLDAPNKLPTWDELTEFAMRFIIDEGYVPMPFDGADDVASFIDVAKRKEQYGQKVRREMRGYVKDSLEIWIYLGQIGQQAAFDEWEVQMKVDTEAANNADRAALADGRRMANLDRRESVKERKFADAQRRASYGSTTRERRYNSRQDQLKFQQTLLNDRYTRSYRW